MPTSGPKANIDRRQGRSARPRHHPRRPPGTGKTLLARAVAGECGAHIEIVNGPALLSKWVGETEAALRAVFERAQKLAPAVVLFDEIDPIAPSRSAESAQHQVSVVAQLLVLLDGIEERGQIFVLATTNRPEHVDAALRHVRVDAEAPPANDAPADVSLAADVQPDVLSADAHSDAVVLTFDSARSRAVLFGGCQAT